MNNLAAIDPCLPREGGVGVADGGSVKGQTPPVSHPLDSPLGEGAKKDCAYARKICTNLTACRRAGACSRRGFCTNLWLPTRPPCVKGAGAANAETGGLFGVRNVFFNPSVFLLRKNPPPFTQGRLFLLLQIAHNLTAIDPCLAPGGEVAREA